MGYYMRYFADGSVNLKAISAGLKGVDPNFKIDGGELTHGAEMLGEIEINNAGSDLFAEELGFRLNALHQVNTPAAQHVMNRLRSTQSIVMLHVLDSERDPNVTWQMLGPLWTVLPQISTGMTQVDGQGFYDGSQLVVQLP